MSLPRHLFALMLAIAPLAGCEVEDEDPAPPAAPAPVEPSRPIPEPQVMPAGRTERVAADAPPADGPAFAPLVA